MLIEMLPDMPDCLADVVEWQPISYTEHFSKSGFHDAELTIKAYHSAPKDIRQDFDSLIADITVTVIEIIKQVEKIVEGGNFNDLRILVKSQVRELRSMIDAASGIINGADRVLTMNEDFFEECDSGQDLDSRKKPIMPTGSGSQDDIDAILNA